MDDFERDHLDNFMSQFKFDIGATFKRDCLEFDLGNRLTTPIHNDNKLQIMVAVSGAGKTRRIYEELYSRPGIFFTCKKQGNGGSDDLWTCIQHCVEKRNPQYLELVAICRVMILRWMMLKKGITDSRSLLLAQIHPEKVFGGDIFLSLYYELKTQYSDYECNWERIRSQNWLVAIDEIQTSLKTKNVFVTTGVKDRPAFSVLLSRFIQYFNFGNIVVSGTGINYTLINELLESSTFKPLPLDHRISDFQPLSQDRAYKFSMNILCNMLGWSHDLANKTATLISNDPLFCNARARFTSFILGELAQQNDKYLENAIDSFYEVLRNPGHCWFPIRDWDKNKGDVVVRAGKPTETYETVLTNTFMSYLRGREAVIEAAWQDDAFSKLISMGIGFVSESKSGVTLVEKAVECALFTLIPAETVTIYLINEIARDSNRSINGYRFELVVLAKYMKECQSKGHRMRLGYGTLSSSLSTLDTTKENEWVFILPDAFAGIYRTFLN